MTQEAALQGLDSFDALKGHDRFFSLIGGICKENKVQPMSFVFEREQYSDTVLLQRLLDGSRHSLERQSCIPFVLLNGQNEGLWKVKQPGSEEKSESQ